MVSTRETPPVRVPLGVEHKVDSSALHLGFQTHEKHKKHKQTKNEKYLKNPLGAERCGHFPQVSKLQNKHEGDQGSRTRQTPAKKKKKKRSQNKTKQNRSCGTLTTKNSLGSFTMVFA